MKLFVTTALAALVMGSGAFANEQMALSMGLEPGVYSDVELIQLRAAMDEDDHYRVHQLLKKDNSAVISTQSVTTTASGRGQIEHQLGVEGQDVPNSELVRRYFD